MKFLAGFQNLVGRKGLTKAIGWGGVRKKIGKAVAAGSIGKKLYDKYKK